VIVSVIQERDVRVRALDHLHGEKASANDKHADTNPWPAAGVKCCPQRVQRRQGPAAASGWLMQSSVLWLLRTGLNRKVRVGFLRAKSLKHHLCVSDR